MDHNINGPSKHCYAQLSVVYPTGLLCSHVGLTTRDTCNFQVGVKFTLVCLTKPEACNGHIKQMACLKNLLLLESLQDD